MKNILLFSVLIGTLSNISNAMVLDQESESIKGARKAYSLAEDQERQARELYYQEMRSIDEIQLKQLEEIEQINNAYENARNQANNQADQQRKNANQIWYQAVAQANQSRVPVDERLRPYRLYVQAKEFFEEGLKQAEGGQIQTRYDYEMLGVRNRTEQMMTNALRELDQVTQREMQTDQLANQQIKKEQQVYEQAYDQANQQLRDALQQADQTKELKYKQLDDIIEQKRLEAKLHLTQAQDRTKIARDLYMNAISNSNSLTQDILSLFKENT